MTNLPNWKSADAVYSKAYRLLERMALAGHVTKQRKQVSVSEDMRDLVDALNIGDEERIKGLIMLQSIYGAV